MRTIWNITRNPTDARDYIEVFYPRHPAEARELMRGIIYETEDCLHLTELCLVDFLFEEDEDWVRQLIRIAKHRKYINQPMINFLELRILDFEEFPRECFELATTITARNDYPPEASYISYYTIALYHLRNERFDLANEIIDRMLSIHENMDYRVLKMALSLKEGRDDISDQLKKLIPAGPGYKDFALAQAYFQAGFPTKAREYIGKCSREFLQAQPIIPSMKKLVLEILKEKTDA